MKNSNDYLEEILYEDAKNIYIDLDYKAKLKNKIMQKNKKKIYRKYSVLTASVLVLVLISINFNSIIKKQFNSNTSDVTRVHAAQLYIKSIAKLTNIIETGYIFSPVVNPEGTKIIYSSEDNMYEMSIDGTEKKKLPNLTGAYTPSFSRDGSKIIFAKNNGIYVENLETRKIDTIIKSDNPSEIFSRPQFAADGSIIYFKAVTSPNLDSDTGRIKTDNVIYSMSAGGKNNLKIVDGQNPALSKDGKRLAYEADNKIYIMNLDTKEQTLVDTGKLPAWSPSGEYISYIKDAQEVTKYNKVPKKNNLYLEKQYSSIWIAHTKNLNLKYKITEEEFVQKAEEIEKWAKEVKDNTVDQHFVVSNKYSYFDSSWGKDDSSFYAVRSSEKGGFELMKFELESK